MRLLLLTAAMLAATATTAQAQDATTTDSHSGTSFRGFRIEGDVGGDRYQAQGTHNNKFGYGGTVGFDGQIGRVVIGPEASYWRANNWSQNCTGETGGGTLCNKSFEEWGAAVRAGYLVTPQTLVFAKGGYVSNEQRQAFAAPAGGTPFYNHYRTDGYQVGGGVEYTVGDKFSGPLSGLYVSGQYVYSQYDDHTARQRAMLGVGLRFK
ncbi:hypothetical protein DMC47_38410 [Nostoc sp. 3335mG]|nr:hypothetical protein DMC47_38410 [Nostoc sp. 3335mG]